MMIPPPIRSISNTIRQSIATISLNSRPNRNALSYETLQQLSGQFHEFLADPSVKVVVLESKVDNIFSSGHDLKEIRRLQKDNDVEALRKLFRLCSQVMTDIVLCEKPVIAKIDGIATAAGCQLVASCDLAYASNRSRFATPGVNLGLFCSTPGVALGRSVGRKHAMEMLLTGNAVSAADAERMGLINRAISVGELDSHVNMVAESIASKSQEAIFQGKPLFHTQMEMDLKSAYHETTESMVRSLIDGEESKEGIGAFLTKRTPVWPN